MSPIDITQPVPGVVIRDGLVTLVSRGGIKPGDLRLVVAAAQPDWRATAAQALEALEGVAQWVNSRPNTHPWDAWQRVEPSITALRALLNQEPQS